MSTIPFGVVRIVIIAISVSASSIGMSTTKLIIKCLIRPINIISIFRTLDRSSGDLQLILEIRIASWAENKMVMNILAVVNTVADSDRMSIFTSKSAITNRADHGI